MSLVPSLDPGCSHEYRALPVIHATLDLGCQKCGGLLMISFESRFVGKSYREIATTAIGENGGGVIIELEIAE